MLDNPIWHSLRTRHSYLAIGNDVARRYPADVTPFFGFSEASEDAARELERLSAPGERIGILSVIPPLSSSWEVLSDIEIHQYVWPEDLASEPDSRAAKLGEEHVPAMLELTALVYPAYFRKGTAALGDYYGIFENGRLQGMAGIRMSMDGHQELSAICTHPDSRGKGYAAALTKHLLHEIQAAGDIGFLHTESYNAPAKALYEKLGFRLRKKLPFKVVQRSA